MALVLAPSSDRELGGLLLRDAGAFNGSDPVHVSGKIKTAAKSLSGQVLELSFKDHAVVSHFDKRFQAT